MKQFFHHHKHKITKSRIIALVAILVATASGFVLASGLGADSQSVLSPTEAKPMVKVIAVNDLAKELAVETSGVVKSATEVEVVALTGGTVQALTVEVGQAVQAGQVMARLYDATTLTSAQNALTNYNNSKLSVETTKRLAEDSVRQAEVGYQNAVQSVESAKISLRNAQDALANTSALQEREVDDANTSAVIAIDGYLNTIGNALEQVNYILKVEGTDQLPGIAPVLGAKSPLTVPTAEDAYRVARTGYTGLQAMTVTSQTVGVVLPQVVTNLKQTLSAVQALTTVLENTVSSNTFSDSALLTQKNSFATLRTNVGTASNGAENRLQTIQNLPLKQKQQRDSLESGVRAAESQLALAEIGLKNAEIALSQAKQSRDNQVQTANSSLDSIQGQLALAQSQAADLNVTTPISGQVIAKKVDQGDEVNPGQTIVTVAQSELVKIEINLTSDEVYMLDVGQVVYINNDLEGFVSRIDPSADPVNRKVGVEIIFDNANKQLIPETFVDVRIPLTDKTESSKIQVPLKAVTINQTERFVYILEDNKAKKTSVEIGAIIGADIEIISELPEDALLIIEGSKQLQDGSEVIVAE